MERAMLGGPLGYEYLPSIRCAACSLASLAAEASKPAEKPTRRGRKRNTKWSGAELKVIAALSKHHKYSDGSCLNQEPIALRHLASMAGVSPSAASKFLRVQFGSYAAYRDACRLSSNLAASLRLLNQEFRPWHLLGNRDVAVTEADSDAE